MPKLWSETIESHRHAVRDAILETTWKLVDERGPLSVTMTQVADGAGIGRATLYKYFPDVETILRAQHERHVAQHLDELTHIADAPATAAERLRTLLSHYARICHYRARHGSADLAALLHQGSEAAAAEVRLHELFTQVIEAAGTDGDLRTDVTAGELASYCLHALGAAARSADEPAVRRLVDLTVSALHLGSETT